MDRLVVEVFELDEDEEEEEEGCDAEGEFLGGGHAPSHATRPHQRQAHTLIR